MVKRLFITGKLAVNSLNRVMEAVEPDFDYEIIEIDITVAALIEPEFLIKELSSELLKDSINHEEVSEIEIIIPGRCQGDFTEVQNYIQDILEIEVQILKGPEDLRNLPEYFGFEPLQIDLEQVERQTLILAEVVDAPLLSKEEILTQAAYYRESGADIIDLGCTPEVEFSHLEEVITALKEKNFKVSIDTLNQEEIKRANSVGVDYVLSINSDNIESVRGAGFKPVVIPDSGQGLSSLRDNMEAVEAYGCREYIIDPILDPINFGFSKALARFIKVKEEFGDKEILIGIGNVTELTDVDSTGINGIMAGIISELGLDYVLSTEVASRAKGAVKELDLALRLMDYAKQDNILPKNLSDELTTIKDLKPIYYDSIEIKEIAEKVTDSNYRIFIDGKKIYVFNGKEFVQGEDPQQICKQLDISDPDHAFYLGTELQKAYLALTLGKEYYQDDPLNWGYLTKDYNQRSGTE